MAVVIVSTQTHIEIAHCSECYIYFLIPEELDAMHHHEDTLHYDDGGPWTSVVAERIPFILGERQWLR